MQIDIFENKSPEAITERIKLRLKRTAEDIVLIGNDLIQLKEQLGHGMFEAWIKENFEMSLDSAQNFIRVARTFPEIPNNSVFKPTLLYELAKPSTSPEVREKVIEKVEAGENVTVKQVKTLKRELKYKDELLERNANVIEKQAEEISKISELYIELENKKQESVEIIREVDKVQVVYPDGFKSAEEAIQAQKDLMTRLQSEQDELQEEIDNKSAALEKLNLERDQQSQIKNKRAGLIRFQGSVKKLLADHQKTKVDMYNLSKVMTPEIMNDFQALRAVLLALVNEINQLTNIQSEAIEATVVKV